MALQEVCPICQCGRESCENCTKESDNCNSIDSCCCADNTHVLWHEQEVRKGLYLEYFSLGWMSIEVTASIIAGLIIGKSFALLAFAGDSIIELISAYAVLSYLRNVSKGKLTESESERTERIALLLLIMLIPIITLGAIYSYASGIKPEASLLGIVVAIGAVMIMPILWIQKKTVGREANIHPLTIDAAESATCFFMSIALLGGLVLNYILGIFWADYVATAIILVFVILEIRESLEEMRHP
jgi:divalent metal cation (Fe/Co/Zn/Cd) transporter